MKPLDIDGNELKVGDDVEVVVQGTMPPIDPSSPIPRGGRYTINDIAPEDAPWKMFMIKGSYIGLGETWKLSTHVRLIPRDTKAPTKIEFVTTKEGVR